MTQQQKDQLAAGLGITPNEQDVLDVGSAHPFTCRCSICREWWIAMGPENADEEDDLGYEPKYGPFTKEEIEGNHAD